MVNTIHTLTQLGESIKSQLIPKLDQFYPMVYRENPWFTKENVAIALQNWANTLNSHNINRWLQGKEKVKIGKKVGVVAAGNIPLVGMHDFLSVICMGHQLMYKKSQSDAVLIAQIYELLKGIDPNMAAQVSFVDKVVGVEAVIATGSNNTSRYFEYYFSKVPSLIRKNRTSVAVLTGNETEEELRALVRDVFTYFGMGCRNVSHLFLPVDYDIIKLLPYFEAEQGVREHTKYMNNYDYHRAMYLMNMEKFYDTGNILAVESSKLYSNMAMLHFQYYSDLNEVKLYLDEHEDMVQCVVGQNLVGLNAVSFGQTQCPSLWEYADNKDILEFLRNL